MVKNNSERKRFPLFGGIVVYEALLYAIGMLCLLGLVPKWGDWYSQNFHHRAQTDALLHGRLALSESPARLTHDLTWSEDGVHQVWGLGIPAWRLPLEATAKAVGAESFPDRLAFGATLAMVAGLVLATFLFPPRIAGASLIEQRSAGQSARLSTPNGYLTGLGAVLILLLFPAFLGLLNSRFDIYEEVVAYEYLYGLVLLCLVSRLARCSSNRAFYLLCVLAGLGGFVRPTLVFYGFAAVIVGGVALWIGKRRGSGPNLTASLETVKTVGSNSRVQDTLLKQGVNGKWKALIKPLAAGCLLFCLGGGLLFWTNLARFGSGFEFGHKLNVQYLYGSMYATRFDHPYQSEPLLSAGRELFGLMFLAKKQNGGVNYQKDLFPGQSATVRWRELYLTTYNPAYWVGLAGGVLAGAWWGWRWFRFHRSPSGRATETGGNTVFLLALWGTLSAVILGAFLLRSPVISSRYLLDFMPAFGAIMVAGWLGWCALCQRWRWENHLLAGSLVVLAGWVAWEYSQSRSIYGGPQAISWQEVQRRQAAMHSGLKPLPDHYDLQTKPMACGIPYNGAGWFGRTNPVSPLVILFVNDPQFLELHLAGAQPGLTDADVRQVRAKVGLEFLEQESIQQGEQGWTVRFRGPQQKRYQQGLQAAFLAFVLNPRLADVESPWRLLKVQWKEKKTG